MTGSLRQPSVIALLLVGPAVGVAGATHLLENHGPFDVAVAAALSLAVAVAGLVLARWLREARALAGKLELANAELSGALRTAEASSAQVRRLFTESPLPMWAYDPATLRFLDVNVAAVAAYGYSREEFLAMTLRDIRLPEDVPRLMDMVERDARSGRVVRDTHRHVTKDGSLRRVELTAQDTTLDGREARLVVVFDVTERERAAEREQEARAVAEEANRAKADFLATMSHELRTPLNAIAGYAQLLDMGLYGTLSEEQRGVIGRVDRAQRHLLGLIDDVLNHAKLEAGRVRYDVCATMAADVVAEAAAMSEPAFATKRVALEVECPVADASGRSVAVWADRHKLRQVLLNLLSNATKFTPSGGRVRLHCVPGGDTVLIRISDTGVGIPADKLEAVFEPFVQVDTSRTREHQGTGLGLAISRDLARGMGGELSVTSAPGHGSTFTVTLRRHTVDAGGAADASTRADSAPFGTRTAAFAGSSAANSERA